MRENQPLTGKEKLFPEKYNLLSTTDTSSVVTYASKDFCEVAGFSAQELIGQPHNIVRHPDMPPEAFENMWSHIQNGHSWMGLVKNRCKNGDHYWVDAFATPIISDGKTVEYQSVRLCPKREHVDRAEKVYAQLKGGKKPRQLKLPRTRLWQRCSLAFIFSFFVAFIMANFAGSLAGLLTFLILSIISVFALTRRLEKLAQESREVFDNPLMELVYNGTVDDISEIQLAMKMRQSELNAVVGRILDSSDQVREAAVSSRNNGHKTASNLEDQKNETEQIAAAINEMHSTANEMAQNTQSASDAAAKAQLATTEGMETVNATVSSIQELAEQLNVASAVISELEDHGKKIGAVSDVIQGIAEQTNLLALNAAIEAARAGEQGRGFAVVADEVRALAKRTQESTREIQNVIGEIQDGTRSAVDAMAEGSQFSELCVDNAEKAGEALKHSLAQVNGISDRNHQIAVAVEEQAAVSDEMNSNIQSISELSAASDSLAKDTVKECDSLVEQLEEQARLVEQFRRTS